MHTVWSYLFAISIAQGFFLLILLFKGKEKHLSFYFITSLLVLLLITNMDFYIVSSGLFQFLPHFFNVSMGMMFLFGPIFYFYVKSCVDANFKWTGKLALHFAPYVINILLNYQFYLASGELKISFINYFLAGHLDLRLIDKVLVALQTLHLFIYLYFAGRILREHKSRPQPAWVIPMAGRRQWLNVMAAGLAVYTATIGVLLLITILRGKLSPLSNYIYTMLTSVGVYLVSYKSILKPAVVIPDFSPKYKTSPSLAEAEENDALGKLAILMDNEKVYKNAALRLEGLARQLNLSEHQLSRLINQKFGKSFPEYLNEYRVNEFINMINSEEYVSYSLFGVASEAGFNSKSTFNSIFKKVTGKTPSEFRKDIEKAHL